MDNKIIIPVKEYPAWIECAVFKKEVDGTLVFLYREPYQKQYINIELLNKLLRMDRAVDYIEKYINVLDMLELSEDTKKIIRNIYKMLTENETVKL